MNEIKVESNNLLESNNTETADMVPSGLPLIMVKGRIRSLDSMTISELETFIPFMASCSIQREKALLVNNVPIWWKGLVPFTIPLQKPNGLSDLSYKKVLASIVYKCYYHHNQLYIIHFCSNYVRTPNWVITKANRNNTTSLICRSSKIHILTFNNENQEYDMVKKEPPKSPRRCLLPNKPVKEITDVYLCENCDAEFNTQAAINGHERLCYGPLEDPIEIQISPPYDLLGYLQLGKEKIICAPKRPLEISLAKNRLVEFSSILGRRMLEEGVGKRAAVSKPEKLIQLYESYCFVSPRTSKTRDSYEFRPCNNKLSVQLKKPTHYHRYSFSIAERRERYLTLQTGLNNRSRNILRKCKECFVRLVPWTPPPPRPQPNPIVIDLCSSDDE